MKQIIIILLVLSCIACKNDTKTTALPTEETSKSKTYTLKYAKGFSITDFGTYKVLTITKPWPNAQTEFKYALISQEHQASITLNKDDYNGIITTPVKRLVTTSTTHLPALELLDKVESLVGFPGTDYISSEVFRTQVDNKSITEIGQNQSINTEVLLSLKPDVVVGFGVDGTNKTFETIKKANIPVIYNADWVESSPLAKAEWIKFFGLLFHTYDAAETIFNSIESDYNAAKALAKNAKHKPTVLSGAMHKDVWYLPNGQSTEAQLLNDANVNYLWKDTTGNGSLALSFESVFKTAKDADLWISPSYYKTTKALTDANAHYKAFKPYKTQNIYTFSNTIGATGGVLYYELGLAKPNLILKDIIKIAHPELLPDYTPFFFKRLE